MYQVNVTKECGCFKKSDFENGISFGSKDDALMSAQHMVTHMNEKFCQKHEFKLVENGDQFTIFVDEREQEQHSGCCGGGHCS